MPYDIEQIQKWCKDAGGVNPDVVLEICDELVSTRKEFIEVLRRACYCRNIEDDGLCDFCHLRMKYEVKK